MSARVPSVAPAISSRAVALAAAIARRRSATVSAGTQRARHLRALDPRGALQRDRVLGRRVVDEDRHGGDTVSVQRLAGLLEHPAVRATELVGRGVVGLGVDPRIGERLELDAHRRRGERGDRRGEHGAE
jgi:hypothetical protein